MRLMGSWHRCWTSPRSGKNGKGPGSVLVAALLLSATVLAHEPSEPLRDVRLLAGVRVDLRYAGANNLTGAPVPGYASDHFAESPVLLVDAAAIALAHVQRSLEREGLGLLVYDAYRPPEAVRALAAWGRKHRHAGAIADG